MWSMTRRLHCIRGQAAPAIEMKKTAGKEETAEEQEDEAEYRRLHPRRYCSQTAMTNYWRTPNFPMRRRH